MFFMLLFKRKLFIQLQAVRDLEFSVLTGAFDLRVIIFRNSLYEFSAGLQ